MAMNAAIKIVLKTDNAYRLNFLRRESKSKSRSNKKRNGIILENNLNNNIESYFNKLIYLNKIE
jgi:hypothetical protein